MKPLAPTGVVAHFRDGSTEECMIVYTGHRKGLHVWEVVTPLDWTKVVRVTIASLPARSTVEFHRARRNPT